MGKNVIDIVESHHFWKDTTKFSSVLVQRLNKTLKLKFHVHIEVRREFRSFSDLKLSIIKLNNPFSF